MNDTSVSEIKKLLEAHRNYFGTHQTKPVQARLEALKKLKTAVLKYEKEITAALWKDLHKCYEEAYITEISIVLSEIDYHIKNIEKWAEPLKVNLGLAMKPSTGEIIFEPLGVALIMSPWNYPFQLIINPLIGAISAGCCAMIKPSPSTPSVAQVIQKIINETFPAEYISVIQGGREVNEIVFAQRFDMIFFTGSPKVGKVVMKAAAEFLTPVVLELGGKSPCIVDTEADVEMAAKRIMWGKLMNAGQTCVAPDYLFVHTSLKMALLEKMKQKVLEMYGDNPLESKHYTRIVSDEAMQRLKKLLNRGTVVFGGVINEKEKYISPTLIENLSFDDPVMKEEIFGPILPVFTFESIDEPISYINSQEKPLAFYYFGKSEKAKEVLMKTTSGGGCINDTLLHAGSHQLPFGGVGNSGMGIYHGHASFLAFSNQRSMVFSKNILDIPMRYAPYKGFEWIKKLI